ncbi:MAG: DUF4163 domain-containing protein, partial [Clostridiales bacterium]|nr:DUF4163 domain-containing protein [Clostridiales bacterium]
MKKAIVYVVLVIFVLSGCGAVVQSPATDGNGLSPSSVVETPSSTPSPSASEAPSAEPSPGYSIVTASFSQDEISIDYPQISGLGDSAKEQKINDYIKNDIWDSQVTEVIDGYKDIDMDIKLTVDMGYRVTLSTSKLLSIEYSGSAYIEGGAHPNNYFYGVTIDLESAARLKLYDFVQIDEHLIEKLRSSAKTLQLFDSAENNSAVIDEVLSNLENGDDHFPIWELHNGSEKNFCLTPDALVVNVYISHVAGDYVLLETPGDYTRILEHSSLYDDFLCLDTERLVMSFKTEKSSKTVSVCTAEGAEPYIVYRFGTKDNIELEYKALKSGQMTYASDTEHYLTFTNQGYEYTIYQVYDAGSGETRFGIKVRELSSGTVTDIEGSK